MNRRILIVADDREVLGNLVAILDAVYEVHTATTADRAFQLCENTGPFAVVISDQDLPRLSGIELLVEILQSWPDTARLLMTGLEEVELAVRALHEGQIFRLLRKPISREDLRLAVDTGVEHFARLQQERLLTEQLMFSRESLLSLTEALEQRLADEIANLRSMQQLASHLNSTSSLEEVAETAATAVSRALGGRPTRVELVNPNRPDERAAGVVGEAPRGTTHVEPVESPEGEIGSIVVGGIDGEALTERDLRILASLVSSTALAAHSQIRRFERDEAQHATVFAMARLAERRDNETGQHLARVSEYCRLVALGLREDGHHVDVITDHFVDDLVRSAPLHDIGKVGIPDNILLKPGKLVGDEWEVMKQHTVIGAETMRSIIESTAQPGFLIMGRDIAWCHHEKWDGTGYPRGIAGEEIPLSARIVALADVYDALTTERPYKKPWSHERAMELILDESGKHFDPDVVAAFAKRAEEACRIRVQLADEPESQAKAA